MICDSAGRQKFTLVERRIFTRGREARSECVMGVVVVDGGGTTCRSRHHTGCQKVEKTNFEAELAVRRVKMSIVIW